MEEWIQSQFRQADEAQNQLGAWASQALHTLQHPPVPSKVVSDAEKAFQNSIIGGLSAITQFPHLLGLFIQDFEKIWQQEHVGTLLGHTGTLIGNYVGHLGKLFAPEEHIFKNFDLAVGRTLINAFFESAMGLTIKDDPKGSQTAIDTMSNLASFLLIVPRLGAVVNLLGKIPFAERWAESLGEELSAVTEELGISWMMGTLLESSFETAVGKPLEEMINLQKRGNRLDRMSIMRLLKQHAFDSVAQGEYELKKQGYPDELISLLWKLDAQQLPVTDLQQAFMIGVLDRPGVRDYLRKLGFSEGDVNLLTKIYIDKAETAGKVEYRTAARTALRDNLLTDSQFTTIMQALDYQQAEIQDEVKAAKLLKRVTLQMETRAAIKNEYDHGAIDETAAIAALVADSFTRQEATELVASWHVASRTTKKRLTATQILRYMVAGVIDPQTARVRLQEIGYQSTDADMLVQNPLVKLPHTNLGLTPGTITGAIRDGLITPAAGIPLYQQAGLNATEAAERAAIANYTVQRRTHPAAKPKQLSEADIRTALRAGTLQDVDAVTRLTDIGYSDADAILLVTTWGGLQGSGIPPTTGGGGPGGFPAPPPPPGPPPPSGGPPPPPSPPPSVPAAFVQEWDEGYTAFESGAPETANPYTQLTPQYTYWVAGWTQAEADQLAGGFR